MPHQRLRLALETMTSGDWLNFEQFAAEFLAVEYPSLRTMASPQGDRGRDGQLYVVEEDTTTAVQYSVAADWHRKINATLERLKANFPDLRQLIYATNAEIGPAADDLRQAVRREQGVFLDIRDRSWFVERELTAPQRQVASEELGTRFVAPLLVERGIRERVGTALNEGDARIALLHLTLRSADEAADKGLTKQCFESLVLAALHDSSVDNRLTIQDIEAATVANLPAGHEQQIHGQVVSALNRLSKRGGPVKWIAKSGEYHLSYDEQQRLRGKTVDYLLEEAALEKDPIAALERIIPASDLPPDDVPAVANDLRRGIEAVLLNRGEAFAEAARSGEMYPVDDVGLLATVTQSGKTAASNLSEEQAAAAVVAVMENPSDGAHHHLRRLADAYTLFAFLQQTPDVQKVVVKMFSNADIWLDTNVILPLFGETLITDEHKRHYTIIMRAALDAGLRIFVTDGVLEEVERHLNLALTCSRMTGEKWHASLPFVFAAFTLAGRPRSQFASWLEAFRGSSRPQDDVRSYLEDAFGIVRRDLLEVSDNAPVELRAAVQDIWRAVHEKRRAEVDPVAVDRLVAHDVENTVGVIERRNKIDESPLGYEHWWLTLDTTAFSISRELKERLGVGAPRSPALSPDFLTQLLRLGPLRTAVERSLSVELPVMADFRLVSQMPTDLLQRADEFRQEASEVSERVVGRRVRDRLDEVRAKLGPESLRGARAAETVVLARLAEQAKQPRS